MSHSIKTLAKVGRYRTVTFLSSSHFTVLLKLEAGPLPRSHTQLGVKTYPASSPFADMSQDYDPGFPNEYAEFSRKLKKLRNQERELEEREKENERRKESEERQR